MLQIEWNYLVNWLVLDSTLSRLLHSEGRRNSSLSIAFACDEFLTHFPKEQDY
jgi:hypothetical protein